MKLISFVEASVVLNHLLPFVDVVHGYFQYRESCCWSKHGKDGIFVPELIKPGYLGRLEVKNQLICSQTAELTIHKRLFHARAMCFGKEVWTHCSY